jgi:hypothetical protein
MQLRETARGERTPLERLLSRGDEAGMEYVTDRLVQEATRDPEKARDAGAAGTRARKVEG